MPKLKDFKPNYQYGRYIEIEDTRGVLELFKIMGTFIPEEYLSQVEIKVKLPFISWKYKPEKKSA